ncbi:MAG: hypothetical protein M9890_02460 [Thermomicrobiales bacterium]|nr:hypothetical protein [Thermomicrobiales bacterium]
MLKRDAARRATHDAIHDARARIIDLSATLHTGSSPDDALALIDQVLSDTGFTIDRDIAGIASTLRAVREHRDSEAERKGLRHGHMAYLADLPADPADWANRGSNAALAATLAAAIGLAAALEQRHEFGIVTFIIGPTGWKAAATAAGIIEPFDSALGVHTAAAGDGYAYTIAQTGDRLGSLIATLTFAGETASAAVADLIAQIPVLQDDLVDHRSIAVVVSDESTVRLEVQGPSRSALIETAVALQDRAEKVAATHGTTVEIDLGQTIDDMIVNRVLSRRVKTYGDTFGLPMDRIHKTPPAAPDTWGNVSYITPSVNVALRVTEELAELGSEAFGALTNTSEAHDQALLLGECLAMTGIDVLRDSTYRAIADDQLVKALSERGINRAHRRWLGVHRVQPGGKKPKRKSGPTVTDFQIVRGPGLPPPPMPTEEDDEDEDES